MTVYDVIGEPPVAGAVHDTRAEAFGGGGGHAAGGGGGRRGCGERDDRRRRGDARAVEDEQHVDPGGAVAALAGTCTLKDPEPAVNESGTKCWLMSDWWVSAPSETRFTALIEAASGVATVRVDP